MKKNYFKSLVQVAILLCAPLFIASCDEFGTEDNPIPSYISMDTTAVTIMKDATFTRTALATSDAAFEYKSENEEIATVNPVTGEVTGKADGTTYIVAAATGYSKGGKKIFLTDEVKYKLTVQDPVGMIAYDFGEAGVPNLVYAGTALNVADIAIAPQKNNGALTFNYTLEEVDDVAATPWTTTPVAPATITKAGVYKVIAEMATKKPYVTFTAPADTASYYVKVVEAVAYSRWDATEKAFKNDTILMSDFDAVYTGTIPTGTLTAGWYFIKNKTTSPWNIQFTGTLKLAGEGDINIVLEDGCTLWFPNGIFDEDDPANPHTLNFFRQVGNGNSAAISYNTTGDVFKNIGTINTYKVNITAASQVEECGGFANIGAINIYDADVACQSWFSVTNGYGAKMKNGGTVTLYKGSFTASGRGTGKAVIGKLDMKAEGKKFIETDDNTAPDADWTAVPATGPTKLYVKTVAAE